MMIEDIVQSCVHESVASAAVQCMGRGFYAEIEEAARAYGLSPGAFTALAVRRFARRSDPAEARIVREAMKGAQAPVLSGLHRILCLMLAAGVSWESNQRPSLAPKFGTAGLDPVEAEAGCSCCF